MSSEKLGTVFFIIAKWWFVIVRIWFLYALSLFLCLLGQPLAQASALHHDRAQFLSFADLHFDPFLACESKSCPFIKKLQTAPASEWPTLFETLDNDAIEYGDDSSFLLLESSLAAIKEQVLKTHPKFILVIGDLLAHDYDRKYRRYTKDKSAAGYRSFVKKTMAFLSSEISRTLPQTEVYFAVGNNDSYNSDYYSEPEGDFFHDMSDFSASMLKNQSNRAQLEQSFHHAGYYAVTLSQQPQLRLIVLNSVLFSRKAKGKKIAQFAEEELAWLQQELSETREHHQKALIVMHIPTGIDIYTSLLNPFRLIEFWKKTYAERFQRELAAAAPELMGVFPAHIHMDSFQMLSTDKGNIPIIGTPSISPFFYNDPGFKVYSYSVPELTLVDFEGYYYSQGAKKWEREYDFNKVEKLNQGKSGVLPVE